jgi:hypothetical protein
MDRFDLTIFVTNATALIDLWHIDRLPTRDGIFCIDNSKLIMKMLLSRLK